MKNIIYLFKKTLKHSLELDIIIVALLSLKLLCRFTYASGLCNKASRASCAREVVDIISCHSPGVASCVTLMEYRVAAKPEP